MTNANKNIVSAALILGVSSLVSRVVGLVRERVFTTTFGAGDTFDAFVAAFRLPDLLFNVVVLGALSAAFIPLFTEKLVKKEEANDFATATLNIVLSVTVLLTIVYVVLADVLVPLITPGFSGDKLEMTVQMARVMAWQPILLCISFVFSGVLNSHKRFLAYAAAPILYNVGIILGVLWLYPVLGVSGLGWGVVLGAGMHMLVQLPSVLRTGWRWRPMFGWNRRDFRALSKMMIPRVVGLGAQQVNLFVVAVIGSWLAAGSITVFHLANNIQSLPVGVFGVAFATAAFPTLAEQVSRKQNAAFKHTLTKTFRNILFFIVPLSMLMIILRAQIVRVLFGDGAFDWEDTILTFDVFGVLLVSLFAQATIPLLVRAFYVRQNTVIPVTISILGVTINIVLAWLLAVKGVWPAWDGVVGLAVAFSVAAIVQALILLGVLHHSLDGFDDHDVMVSLFKISVAAIGAGVVAQLLKYPVAYMVDMSRFWGVFTQLALSGGAGIGIYLVICYFFKCKELTVIWKYLPHKFQTKLPKGLETTRFSGIPE